LANEALAKGHPDAGWLSAAAEDRYLLSIGGKQKWGTQFAKTREESGNSKPWQVMLSSALPMT
jgi:hypothetical protein